MIKIMHLSDLHFSELIESKSYSIPQLVAIEKVFNREEATRPFDRLIVTGDLTDDAKVDSFIRARSWLMDKMPTKQDPTGLSIEEKRLRVIPGNKDFDFSIAEGSAFPDLFFEGLNTYNTIFRNNHLFITQRPHVYDWFSLSEGMGLFIVYINTSFLGEGDPNNKDKIKLVDFLSEQLRELVMDGLNGNLKKKAKETDKISSDDFRKSFKIIVSHHPLQNLKGNDFLNKRVKRQFLANLAIMDFQLQLCGHDHNYELNESIYYTIFDRRAKNRYVINELKHITGFINNKNKFGVLKSLDGRKYSRATKTIFNLLYNLFNSDNDHDDSASAIITDIENIAQGRNNDDIVKYLKTLINKGRKRENLDKDDLPRLLRHIENFDEEKRRDFERNSKLIFSKILSHLKHKSLVSYNSGSSAIPYNGKEERHFNIYEIDCDNMHVALTRKDYQWIERDFGQGEKIGDFRCEEIAVELFSLEKIHENANQNL